MISTLRIGTEPRDGGSDRGAISQVQHEQRLGMRRGRPLAAAGRELEVCTSSGQLEEHAVVAVVIAEPADLGETDTVAIEDDDLAQPLRVTRDAQGIEHGRRRYPR